MQFVFFTNCIFKQIIIYGRQFKFTQVKVVELGDEHYNYNMSCGINNINIIIVTMPVKLQALVYDILPSTTAVFSYTIG